VKRCSPTRDDETRHLCPEHGLIGVGVILERNIERIPNAGKRRHGKRWPGQQRKAPGDRFRAVATRLSLDNRNQTTQNQLPAHPNRRCQDVQKHADSDKRDSHPPIVSPLRRPYSTGMQPASRQSGGKTPPLRPCGRHFEILNRLFNAFHSVKAATILGIMSVATPRTLEAALNALREAPDAHFLAGGTDFMVEVNAGHRRPGSVIALSRVPELRTISTTDTTMRIGAGVTYADFARPPIADVHPALAAAARTVGSPQIRNAGTIGGNVGTASPAGDTLPVLAALDATIELMSVDGSVRLVSWREFFVGVKRTSRQTNELIAAVHVPLLDSRQDYLKVGTRNAMVISVAGLALVVDFGGRNVRVGLGSVGPVPLRADDAETWIGSHIDWDSRTVPDPRSYETFGTMVADAAKPISDHRSTAEYRRHAVGVMAQRALMRLV
jgi:CO/xanthine dehydrogenase FAD-binding subunit